MAFSRLAQDVTLLLTPFFELLVQPNLRPQAASHPPQQAHGVQRYVLHPAGEKPARMACLSAR